MQPSRKCWNIDDDRRAPPVQIGSQGKHNSNETPKRDQSNSAAATWRAPQLDHGKASKSQRTGSGVENVLDRILSREVLDNPVPQSPVVW